MTKAEREQFQRLLLEIKNVAFEVTMLANRVNDAADRALAVLQEGNGNAVQ